MLDQNTDRMWYVIGAVLVGAAIILIANGTLPQLFASVTDSFQNVSNTALDGVEQASEGANLIRNDIPLYVNASGRMDTSRFKEENIIKLSVETPWTGMYFDVRELDLKPDTYYAYSYSFKKLDGILLNIGGHTGIYSSGDAYETFTLDGVRQPFPYDLKYTEDEILYDFTGTEFLPDDTELHTVEMTFKTPAEDEDVSNDEDDQGMYRVYIQPNRGYSIPVTIEIYDLALREVNGSSDIIQDNIAGER